MRNWKVAAIFGWILTTALAVWIISEHQPAQAVVPPPHTYQYYALNIGDLAKDLKEYPPDPNATEFQWRGMNDEWKKPASSAPAASRESAKITRTEALHNRVIAELNRLGGEGWELCPTADVLLSSPAVKREFVLLFRRPR
jgi:hypothetical protein